MVDENEFFREATLRISSSLDIEAAMARCTDYLKGFLPVSGMLFGLYEPEMNVGRILAAIWPDDMKRLGTTIQFPLEWWDWMRQRHAKDPEIRIVNDVDSEESPRRQIWSKLWSRRDTSHIEMDLELENQRLGLLLVFTDGKNRYDESHARLISLLHAPFAIAVSNILQHQEIVRLKDTLADDNRYLRRQMAEMTGSTIIGADFGLRDVMAKVHQVAPMGSPVLLMGETGTGKEVIANAIYNSSARKDAPYIQVNCGAIPENLVDSELFGHEKGAFTGAINLKRGRFERAHTGTIFLDEVGDLPPAAQVRLLRVLQQHEIERVGGTEAIPVDVRIISATHRNLEAMVREGKFREDLWFRLNVFPIMIPPLRQRVEDIPALVHHFIELKAKALKIGSLPSVPQDEMERLQAHDWPGNVRELENLVERAMIQSQAGRDRGVLYFRGLTTPACDLGTEATDRPGPVVSPLKVIIAEHIQKALVQAGGKVEGEKGAARLLGLHPSTLRGRMKKLGIPYGRRMKYDSGDQKGNQGN